MDDKLSKKGVFKVGDQFIFDVQLMKEQNITTDGTNKKINTVVSVDQYPDIIGDIIGYENEGSFGQVNACWCIKV